MLAVAIIVFREVFEAALIVSIVMAASSGITGRNRWVGVGAAGGLVGAGLVALFAARIADAFAGIGQELLNASIIFVAVAMLGWHNIWMARHGRELAGRVRAVSHAVTAGTRPLSALALICAAALLREGSETVLFVYSVAASATDGVGALTLGALGGVAAGTSVGIGMYAGLLRIPAGRLFAVTSWMILLLAGGLAAQGAGFLMQADLLPAMGTNVWDTSSLLSETSLLGKVLHTLIGYIAQPAGVQILFYVVTIAVILLLMRLVGRGMSGGRVASTALLAAVSMGGLLIKPAPARADFKVRSPIVEFREFEFEHNGSVTFDSRRDVNRDQSYTYSVGVGVTPWWKIELEGETGAPPGNNLKFQATTLENTFQLTPQGKYFLDLGFFYEYSRGYSRGSVSTTKFGPLLQKEASSIGGFGLVHTLNLLFEREVGPLSTHRTGFKPAWQTRVQINPFFEPGFEIYGSIDDLGRAGKIGQQQHSIGPVVAGAVSFSPYGRVKYEVGYLLGMTSAAPRGALRWKFEYELSF